MKTDNKHNLEDKVVIWKGELIFEEGHPWVERKGKVKAKKKA